MNRTNIEWCDYTWNPITGCLHGCEYCYARKITERFKNHYPNGFEPTFWPERLNELSKLKKPSKIFTCSMADMFGAWVDIKWIQDIADVFFTNPQHQFQILTKNPWRTDYNSVQIIWPTNVWIGTTVECFSNINRIWPIRRLTNSNGIRFVSFEPLLGDVGGIGLDLQDIDWVIIGALTGPSKKPPKSEWVGKIIRQADKHNIPVFLKDNLGPLLDEFGGRQEYPER